MATQAEKVALLRAYNASLLADDEELAESESVMNESLEARPSPEAAIENESIAMRRRRPVLAIKNGAAVLEFKDAGDVPLWKARLQKAAAVLAPRIAAVGRIELTRNPDYSWVGTGWLVHPRYLVTNRHVAEIFARGDGDRFVFQPGLDGDMAASIDLLQEIGRDDKQVFQVNGVSYIEQRPGLDLAFLEVEQIDGKVATPVVLSSQPPRKGSQVATIGYPAYDSRIPEPDLMKQIYGDVYDKKRIAPGAITEADDDRVLHNCTTLGGNSGSVVVDLDTGEAIGLHFSGSFLRANYAVRADRVAERLKALLGGTLRARREIVPSGARAPQGSVGTAIAAGRAQTIRGQASGSATSITIPLTITVSLGAPAARGNYTARQRPRSMSAQGGGTGDDDLIDAGSEARPEDYANRKGYLADFLGDPFRVDLPEIVEGKSDIATYDGDKQVLPYEHFSVVMNAKRRQCFFSACNIDGARSKSSRRQAWRFDPRIPQALQIMKECYGDPPKFSRGHMTRREDPAWGSSDAEIQRGADDSMHVTNATPQMQSFNAPIWLGLEDYALQHARDDDQKISVFTGPYFTDDDPTMFGVRIPLKFWKVIAFVHDETGKLCATGYEISQEDNLEQQEFVFGDFVSPQLNISTQVAISTIESRAGISFGGLAALDPLANEGLADETRPLLFPGQIRFI
jgi:endonuclease G